MPPPAPSHVDEGASIQSVHGGRCRTANVKSLAAGIASCSASRIFRAVSSRSTKPASTFETRWKPVRAGVRFKSKIRTATRSSCSNRRDSGRSRRACTKRTKCSSWQPVVKTVSAAEISGGLYGARVPSAVLQSGDAWVHVSSVESSPGRSRRVRSSTTTSSWHFSTSVPRVRATRLCCRAAMLSRSRN